ncbi:hypothetical protein AA313_de0207878 [Arthrobotrys entomopaga]|nr:hypothetical protein AA313_de0207878 [Arthrobotrys entomopaga]
MRYYLIISLLSTVRISSSFRIQFKYAENDEVLPLAPPLQWSPRNPECRFIEGSEEHDVDFIEVQNSVPGFGEAPGGIAFYTDAEDCANDYPRYIATFYRLQNSIQHFIPIQAIQAGGNLQGEWTFGDNNDLPQITYWKNVIRGSPVDAFLDEYKVHTGTSLVLFHEGWAAQEDGVDIEPLPVSMSPPAENREAEGPPMPWDDIPGIQTTPTLGVFITSQIQEPDGTKITLFSDGTSHINIPGGLLVKVYADGTADATQTGPDGFYMEFDPQLGVQIRDREGREIFLSPEELNKIDLLYESGALVSRERFNEAVSSVRSGLQHLSVGSPHAIDFLKYMNFDSNTLENLDKAWNPLQSRPPSLQITGLKEPEMSSPDFGGNRLASQIGGSPIVTRIREAAIGAYNWLTNCPRRKSNTPVSTRPYCNSGSQAIDIGSWDNIGVASPDAESNSHRLARVHPGSQFEVSQLDNKPAQQNAGPQRSLTFGQPESLSPKDDNYRSGLDDGEDNEANFTFENRESLQEIKEEDDDDSDEQGLRRKTWQKPQVHYQGDNDAQPEMEEGEGEGGLGQLAAIDEVDEFEDPDDEAGKPILGEMAGRVNKMQQRVRNQSQPDQEPADQQ